MATTKLTPQVIAKAKPPTGETATGKPIKQSTVKDSEVQGLELRVSRSGRKAWSLRYRPRLRSGGHGRQRRKSLGLYPQMTLADARAEARSIIGEAARGNDPLEEQAERRRKTEQRRQLARNTFRAIAARYLDDYALGTDVGPRDKRTGELLDVDGASADVWNYTVREGTPHKRSWGEDRRKLRAEVLDAWGDFPINEISRRQVRVLVDGINRRGHPVQANRTRALLHKLFAWAVEQDILQVNPATGTPRPGGSEQHRQRDRVLTAHELRAFWAVTEPGADEVMTAPMSAFWRLRLITAQRAGEVVAIRWNDLDLEDGWWTIPATVSKNRRSHRVPLSGTAIEIIVGLPRFTDHLLAGALGNRQRSQAAMSIHDEIDDFRGHDLRRTAASWMTSNGVSRLVVAKVLNHAERGVTAVYDRHSYDPEKRVALDTWAGTLAAILARKDVAKVVPFARQGE